MPAFHAVTLANARKNQIALCGARSGPIRKQDPLYEIWRRFLRLHSSRSCQCFRNHKTPLVRHQDFLLSSLVV